MNCSRVDTATAAVCCQAAIELYEQHRRRRRRRFDWKPWRTETKTRVLFGSHVGPSEYTCIYLA